ncbi:DNA repair protein RecO [Pararhizobium mangrovi]|uniref:DNA repair protein RecO n=1 Tax=Pararhizobium mangrovi TaxID=2590452 RepID=A0A506UC52_9HYPH|nr:DNA repair protein RecO [Pararhizobium mangrovi]TPW32003.1 DNA repair protein RecO [Pararhizobium mangrovi]
MQWHDEGVILGIKRHGETSVVAEVMTRDHGRHMGLVHGGRSRRQQPLLQPGNRVDLVWRARLADHLGAFRVEPLSLRAARLMERACALYGVQAMAALLRLLPERDPHPALYAALDAILDALHEPASAGELFVRFELAVLDELGFGLDLTRCASTGATAALVYVSPKSGRAVSREAGLPFADRLLALPPFLADRQASPEREDLTDAFRLTGFFLVRNVYEPRGIAVPSAREAFVRSVLAVPADTAQ